MLTSNEDSSEYDPKSWQLYGSFDRTDYFLLDSRKEELFDYRMQQRYFPINNSPQSYKYYVLRICKYSRGFIHVVNNRQNTPLSSGYSHFSLINTVLPPGIQFDQGSGTFYGDMQHIHSPWHVTVAGEDMLDHTRSQASFSVYALGISK